MVREGKLRREDIKPESPPNLNRPAIGRLQDEDRDPLTGEEQADSAAGLGFGDELQLEQIRRPRPEPEPAADAEADADEGQTS
jgi:hypothetical protein